MKNKKHNMFNWESEEEKLRRYMRIPPAKKLEALRRMNEFFDQVLTDEQKAIRRKLRETKH